MSGQIGISKLYLVVLYGHKPRLTSPPATFQTISENLFSESQLTVLSISRRIGFRYLQSSTRGALMRTVGWSALRSVLAGLAFIGPVAIYLILFGGGS